MLPLCLTVLLYFTVSHRGSISPKTDKVDSVVIDCTDLKYISSAGLRVLLIIKKSLQENELILHNVNEPVMDILDTTGFSDLLTVVAE